MAGKDSAPAHPLNRSQDKECHLKNRTQEWIDAKKKYRLTDLQIQMARELGMNHSGYGQDEQHWKIRLFYRSKELRTFRQPSEKILDGFHHIGLQAFTFTPQS